MNKTIFIIWISSLLSLTACTITNELDNEIEFSISDELSDLAKDVKETKEDLITIKNELNKKKDRDLNRIYYLQVKLAVITNYPDKIEGDIDSLWDTIFNNSSIDKRSERYFFKSSKESKNELIKIKKLLDEIHVLINKTLSSQRGSIGDIKKLPLYNLRRNEVISFEVEYGPMIYSSDSDFHYFLPVYDTLSNKTKFIIDGRTVQSMSSKNTFLHIGSNNFAQIAGDSTYIYAYYNRDIDSYYVNLNGKIVGPYENVNLGSHRPDGRIYFSYREGNRDYIYMNGVLKGPFEGKRAYLVDVFKDGCAYIVREYQTEREYIVINNKVFGPYKNIYNHSKYDMPYFECEKFDNQWNVISNLNEFGPYEKISSNDFKGLSEVSSFKRGYGWYIFQDGKQLGPYKNPIALSRDGRNTIQFVRNQYDDEDTKELILNDNVKFPLNSSCKNMRDIIVYNEQKFIILCNESIVFDNASYSNFSDIYSYSYIGSDLKSVFIYSTDNSDDEFSHDYYLQFNSKNTLLEDEVRWWYDIDWIRDRNNLNILSTLPKNQFDLMINGEIFYGAAGFNYSYNEDYEQFQWLSMEGDNVEFRYFKLR